ncbi:MAG TPA: tRNA guanosine(34) transglycosylase Tgt [Chthoniobacteraceae bacterium]|jgi:queuine tRNA-ribosyltransferase
MREVFEIALQLPHRRGAATRYSASPMSSSRLDFQLQARATGSEARAATFRTLHNEVLTPLFMPVGTQATVKAQLPQSLEDSGSQILLANTYHLLLRPGPEVFRRTGGIHGFMSWPKSVLTDSGGFQIFSLPHSRSMSEEGASFQSYLDGRTILLSPELSIETQKAIGSDIMMALDQCIPSTADEAASRSALELTQRWAVRSLAAMGDSPQSMFGIVQGAVYPHLRQQSAEGLCTLPFDGFAIGGLAVGESRQEREDMCEFTARLLPADKPRYLMGVGTPLDILEAVHRGVDMFDCIIPTQVAQRGGAFTSRGYLQLRRGVYKFSEEVLDPDCRCPTCARYSRAYLHHLTKTGETLGWQLLGKHNIHFYHQLMREIRQSIFEDRFLELYHKKRIFLHEADMDNPVPALVRKPKRPQTTLGDYEVHLDEVSGANIRHVSSGEIMHARLPPMEEARELYVEQARLAERLKMDLETPLTLWDVGLGAAANAMAAIECYEKQTGPVRPLHIVSFENDLDSLKLALRHRDLFLYLRHGGPATLLERGKWQSRTHPPLTWELVQGDFLETMQHASAAPDVIFYDMYSSKTASGPWSIEAFRRLFAISGERQCELLTYTYSTAARAAMLCAGFYVAAGQATGTRAETTVGLTPPALAIDGLPPRNLIGTDWLEKWKRSQAPFPADTPPEELPELERRLLEHPQFQPKGSSAESRI